MSGNINKNGAALPKARTEKLIRKQLDDETLVYILRSHRAISLNSFAASVWDQCDGQTTPDDIGAAIGGPANDNRAVFMALEKLSKENSPTPSLAS